MANHVRLAQGGRQLVRYHLEILVANGMAERVIHALEVIEVDDHERQVPAGTADDGDELV